MDKQVINLKNLSVKYGSKYIWKDATFEINEGQFCAILGPNGAGKSTLFKLLLGLKEPSSGELLVNNTSAKKTSKFIGYVPQRKDSSNQNSLSAFELIKISYRASHLGFNIHPKTLNNKVIKVLRELDAIKLKDKLIAELSGGELQKIYLAESLIDDPKILLLDEPFANLDIKRENELVEVINNLRLTKKITVLLIAHDLNPLSAYVDKVIYIANSLVAVGSIDEVLNSKMLSKLYNSKIEVLTDSMNRKVVVGIQGSDHHV